MVVGPETWWGKTFVALVLVITLGLMVASCASDFSQIEREPAKVDVEIPVRYIDTPAGRVMCVGWGDGLSCDWEGLHNG